ncbi:Holliday junction resolvase RuvX [Candidatus Dependentiae bacterium]
MKILALDLGDKWVGSAISDALGITCRPYKTITVENMVSFLKKVISEENLSKIVLGYPKTIKGTESEQTQKTKGVKAELEKIFPKIEWIFWDERLTSKRADQIMRRGKKDKLGEHSIAAAFILQSYLDHLAFLKS